MAASGVTGRKPSASRRPSAPPDEPRFRKSGSRKKVTPAAAGTTNSTPLVSTAKSFVKKLRRGPPAGGASASVREASTGVDPDFLAAADLSAESEGMISGPSVGVAQSQSRFRECRRATVAGRLVAVSDLSKQWQFIE